MNPDSQSRILKKLASAPSHNIERLVRRAKIQIDFARKFSKLAVFRKNKEWSGLIEEAAALFDSILTKDELETAVSQAETMLRQIGEAAKTYTIHCVGHGHIDMNWMWSWPETVSTTHDTFASVLSLMDQYPDLTYSQSQASVYALIEKYHPDMFEKIKQRVKEGRWEVAAVHWVEGDKNLASGESLCRHLLYTRAYFADRFGLSPEDCPLDWEPDTFGHAISLPGILRKAGVKYYYSCRQGGGSEHVRVGDERPCLFYWQGVDGSKVLVNRESTWYNSYVNIGENIALPLVDFSNETGLRDWLNVYGIGNHGGGPTRTEIDYFLELQGFPIYPTIKFSTATSFFETVESDIVSKELDIPTLDHELNFEFTGCYSSQSLIKQANRFGENYCVEAETLATLLNPSCYPKELIREAWISVLFNQFHDILPGSGVRETREHATALFQEVGAITGAIKRNATSVLASGVDTFSLVPDSPEGADERSDSGAGTVNTPFVAGAGIEARRSGFSVAGGGGVRYRPFIVYNPCAWTRSEPVTATLYDTGFNASRVVAIDDKGDAHAVFPHTGAQDWEPDWGHEKLKVTFLARDIPPLGYRTYLLCEGIVTATDPLVKALDSTKFDTGDLQFSFDRFESGISSMLDKRLGDDSVFDSNLCEWRLVNERPRGMTSWVLGQEIHASKGLVSRGYGVYGYEQNEGTGQSKSHGSIGFLVQNKLVVPGTDSSVRVRSFVHGLAPRIDFEAEIDWREIGTETSGIPGLIIQSLCPRAHPQLSYEIPFGSITRPEDSGEVPTLRYAHVGFPDRKRYAGMTLLQDCKYGHAFEQSCLRMRVVRSSFDPDHAPEIAQSKLRYSLVFHSNEPSSADLTRLGAAWNHPLMVIPATLQNGSIPVSDSFASVMEPNIVLSSLKQAEHQEGLVVRLVNYDETDHVAHLTLHQSLIGSGANVSTVDVMEQPCEGEVSLKGRVVRAIVPAQSFVTILIS